MAGVIEEVPVDAGSTSVSVLIVDDQAPFRRAARTVLSVAPGFEVAGEAESGEDGVEVATRLHPGIVLMDIDLPGISGIEATRRIVGTLPGTVVILLSTYDRDDLPGDARTCGAAAYVHKEDFSPTVVSDVWDAARLR